MSGGCAVLLLISAQYEASLLVRPGERPQCIRIVGPVGRHEADLDPRRRFPIDEDSAGRRIERYAVVVAAAGQGQ